MNNTRFAIFATTGITIDAAATALHNILNNNNVQQQAAQGLQSMQRLYHLQKQITTTLCTREEDLHYVQKKHVAMEYTIQQLVRYTTDVKNNKPEPFDIWTAIVFLHYINDRIKEIRTYFEIQ